MFVYVKLFLGFLIGLIIKLRLKNGSLGETAEKSGVVYSWSLFLSRDAKNIQNTLLAGLLFMLIFGQALNPETWAPEPDVDVKLFWIFSISKRILVEAILATFTSTLGFIGIDIVLRLYGKTGKILLNVIDDKTTNADTDKETGQVKPPTPLPEQPIKKTI